MVMSQRGSDDLLLYVKWCLVLPLTSQFPKVEQKISGFLNRAMNVDV